MDNQLNSRNSGTFSFHGQIRTVYKFIKGARHCELYCFDPQGTVGVLTVPFFSKNIRALESSKDRGNGDWKAIQFLAIREDAI